MNIIIAATEKESNGYFEQIPNIHKIIYTGTGKIAAYEKTLENLCNLIFPIDDGVDINVFNLGFCGAFPGFYNFQIGSVHQISTVIDVSEFSLDGDSNQTWNHYDTDFKQMNSILTFDRFISNEPRYQYIAGALVDMECSAIASCISALNKIFFAPKIRFYPIKIVSDTLSQEGYSYSLEIEDLSEKLAKKCEETIFHAENK